MPTRVTRFAAVHESGSGPYATFSRLRARPLSEVELPKQAAPTEEHRVTEGAWRSRNLDKTGTSSLFCRSRDTTQKYHSQGCTQAGSPRINSASFASTKWFGRHPFKTRSKSVASNSETPREAAAAKPVG
jgi:hypothetical protein